MRPTVACFVGAFMIAGCSCVHADTDVAAPDAERLGWRLGVQAYSFNTITFFEAVDKVRELNLKYIEAMPFGVLSPAHRQVRTNHRMSPSQRVLMKEKLREAGVTLINYGVVPLPNDEAACREVFDFAKDMDIETIVSEPPPEALDLVARLCDEYEIDVAIHNHPVPSAYWDPQTVLNAVKDRTQRMGACADTSHWMRSGLDVVECLRLLEGRIKCFHFGEVSGPEAEIFAKRRLNIDEREPAFPTMVEHVRGIPNVVYGTGPGKMRSWLQEIHRQRIKAVFSIEAFYHLEPDAAAEAMKTSIVYFEGVASELAGP